MQFPIALFFLAILVDIQGLLNDGQESFNKIFKLFSVSKYAKTEIKLFVAMPYSMLPKNFQLNILIFEARASFQILFQSLKQRAR